MLTKATIKKLKSFTHVHILINKYSKLLFIIYEHLLFIYNVIAI